MLRQALAFSLFLIALININKKLIYILIISIATLFHTSASFCFLFIWVDKIIAHRYYFGLFFISLVIYLFKVDFIGGSLIPLFEIEDSVRALRFNYYMNDDRSNSYLGVGFWERIFFFISMMVISNNLRKTNKINRFNNIILNLGISVILLQLIFFSSPTITSRLRYFLVLFPAIYISNYIYMELKNKIKFIFQFLFSIYLIMYLIFQSTYLDT
jgi:hypothetical protein